ncbi:hypothetical protein [Bradyrhizobium sp. WSM1743]|uniref:hypothetical protein n=1 Tax=Bradyrhizobium sp. WSM1743 TaxID=318996 RepID=UPI0003FAF215|nr:hypothetical protein [Bradyrhizobium sp. WSM1743]
MQEQPRWTIILIFATILAGLFILQFGAFIDRATPALIDDHDILYPLGDKPTATLHEIWTDLKNTDEYQELANTGSATRFRPAFYPLKSIKTYLLGNNIRLWYIANFLLYLGTTTVLFSLILHTFGIPSALVFAALYLGHKSWADIFPRLGPVEIECILVGTFLIWLLWRWIETGKASALWLAIPTALLFGATKEADSPLLIAVGGLLLVCGFLSGTRRMVSAGAVLIVTGAIVFAIMLRITATAGTGLVAPWGPLWSYRHHHNRDALAWLVLVPILVLAAAAIARRFGWLKMSRAELAALVLAALSVEVLRLTLYYISFSMTYGGENDAIGMRYGYPLALMQGIVAAFVFGRLAKDGDRRVALLSGAAAIACVFTALVVNRGLFSPYTLKARDWWLQFNTDANTTVSEAARLIYEARKENKDPVLIATGPALEWEPKLSLILFLKRKMPDMVVYFDPNEQSSNALYYSKLSIKLGGTPLAPEMQASLAARGCILVHVDERESANKDCRVLNITSINGRPAP